MSGLLLLAIDTTSEFGSVALLRGAEVLEELAIHSPDGFSPVIFTEIASLLGRNSVTLADVQGFAAASGPGSFTGVRVGLTAVKGLAEAQGRRAAAVSNLQALAVFGAKPLRATVLDARRGEVYGAVYDASLSLVQAEVVMKCEDWLATLPGGAEIISGGYAIAAATEAPRALAAAVGRIAAARFQAGESQLPEALDANYVRRSDAELFWRDLR